MLYTILLLLKTHKHLYPNQFINFGHVDKDQVIHIDYKFDPKVYCNIQLINPNKQPKKERKKRKKIINHFKIYITLIILHIKLLILFSILKTLIFNYNFFFNRILNTNITD